jgi:hypothetical protein
MTTQGEHYIFLTVILKSLFYFLLMNPLDKTVSPSPLMYSIIIPMYKKKGWSNNLNNYRPIAQQNVLSKLLKKVFHIQLTSFLEKYAFLSSNQHGFWKYWSSSSALFQTTDFILSSLDKQLKTIGIFYHLSKASDYANHPCLFRKVNQLAVRGTANQWLHSYFSNWTQTVSLSEIGNNYSSNTTSTTDRVLQGSILGPVLFLICA